jgi:hypothetical protein
MISGIYAIYFDDDGDFNEENIIYIGQSVDIERRMRQHEKSNLDDDYPLIDGLYTQWNHTHKIWHGLTWKILEECSTNMLNAREKYYINKFEKQLLNNENSDRRRIYDALCDTLCKGDEEMDDYYWSYIAPH